MELRDASGKLIGTVMESSRGNLEARNASGKLAGNYTASSNETRDASGKLVGSGNLLSMLLGKSGSSLNQRIKALRVKYKRKR